MNTSNVQSSTGSAVPKGKAFFQDGGCLAADNTSYIVRKADEELYDHLKEGLFCYVLTARQTGKSSIRVRVMDRLLQDNRCCVGIDITSIGTRTLDQERWYYSLLHRFIRDLELDIELSGWWEKNRHLTPVTRFSEFIEEIVLENISKPIVIFIDEIDSMLSLDREIFHTDDFFAAIRAFYNARVDRPKFKRVTFALFGVAAPDDLMQDPARTPFNIGYPIELGHFTNNEVRTLIKGFDDLEFDSEEVLNKIFNWTNGQPYLTQKLCREVALTTNKNQGKVPLVDETVHRIFISPESRDDSNLANVNNRILTEGKYNGRMLEQYQKVLAEGGIVANDRDKAQIYLKLSGLVLKTKDNRLVVSSRIYEEVFNANWIADTQTKINRPFDGDLKRWQATNKSNAALLRGDVLREAFAWANERDDLTRSERGYLEASRTFEEEESRREMQQLRALAKEQEQRAEEQSKSTRQMRIFSVALFVVFLLAVAAAVFAWNQRNIADSQARKAEEARTNADLQRNIAEQKAREAAYERKKAEDSAAREKASAELAENRAKESDVNRKRAEKSAQEAKTANASTERAWRQAKRSETKRTTSLFESHLTHASLLANSGDFESAIKVLNESRNLDPQISPPRQRVRNLIAWYARLAGGTPSQTFVGPGMSLSQIAMDPNGLYVAAVGGNRTVFIYDTRTSEQIFQLKEHAGGITQAIFDPSGEWLATARDNGRIRFTSIPSGKKLGEWGFPDKNTISSMSIHPDGTQIALGFADGKIALRDVKTGTPIQMLGGHAGPVNSILFGNNVLNPLLGSASSDGTARIWNLETGKIISVLTGHTSQISDLAFLPGDEIVATGSWDHTVRFWRIDSGKAVQILHGHNSPVIKLLYVKASGQLVSASRDGMIRVWSTTGVSHRIFQGHKAGLMDLGAHLDELYTSSRDGTIKRWQLGASESRDYLRKIFTRSTPTAIAIAPDGHSIVSGFRDGTLRLYSMSNLETVWETVKAHQEYITRLRFSSDGKRIVSVSLDNSVKIWQSKDGSTEKKYAAQHPLYDVALTKNGQTIGIGDENGTIGLIDLKDDDIRFFQGHNGAVYSVKFDSSGKRLLSTGKDGETKIWNLSSPSPALVSNFPKITGSVNAGAFSPDGTTIASVGSDIRLRIFDAIDSAQRAALVGHEDVISKVIFSPDGNVVATISPDMTVRLWDLHGNAEIFSLTLPAPPNTVWDFDFRCTSQNQGGKCWIAVPLSTGEIVVYYLGKIYG